MTEAEVIARLESLAEFLDERLSSETLDRQYALQETETRVNALLDEIRPAHTESESEDGIVIENRACRCAIGRDHERGESPEDFVIGSAGAIRNGVDTMAEHRSNCLLCGESVLYENATLIKLPNGNYRVCSCVLTEPDSVREWVQSVKIQGPTA